MQLLTPLAFSLAPGFASAFHERLKRAFGKVGWIVKERHTDATHVGRVVHLYPVWNRGGRYEGIKENMTNPDNSNELRPEEQRAHLFRLAKAQ